MALIGATSNSGGGGGAQENYGVQSSAISAGTSITVDCGFQPKHILLGFQYLNSNSWVQVFEVYDAETDANSFVQMYNNAINNRTLPNTQFIGFGAVSGTGFTIINPSYQIKNVYWLATG